MRTKTLAIACCFVLSVLAPLHRAQTSRPGAAGDLAEMSKGPWTVDDVVMQWRATGWTLSRDGTRAVWIKQVPDKKKDRPVPTLMLTDLATGKHRPLSVGKSSVSAARFSPSGRFVSFLSTRKPPEGVKPLPKEEGGAQIWVLDLQGGEARPLTRIPFGVGAYQWLDEETIYLSARERRSRAESRAKERKDDTIVVEDARRFRDRGRRLFRFSLKSKKLERMTRDDEPLGSFAVSPDGRWAAASLSRSPSFGAERDVPPRIVLYDLQQGTRRELFADRRSKPRRLVWRHDSKGLFALTPLSSVDGEDEGAIQILLVVSVPGLDVKRIDLQAPWGLSGPFLVRADGFVAGLANGARPSLARYVRKGVGYERHDLTGRDSARTWSMVGARDADQVIYIHGSASDPDHVVTAVLDGAALRGEREILRPAGGFTGKPIARTEVIHWAGALGERVEGLLYYPHDWKEGARHPLVLITHGGPHGADRDRFSERYANSPNIYCQRGAFVLKTNYHGSSSYGLAFGESIKRRYYELEIEDMFTGIRKLVDDGLVDPQRMGLVGWSNGAILSIAALTLAHLYAPDHEWRFKACAPGAGDVNWTSDYGNCAFGPRFDDYYLGGPPWEMPELYLKKSPLFHVERVETPTIVFFGTRDTNVPTEQGWQWYRALHMVKKAPVRFLLFPNQPHGLRKLSHQRRKLEEELAWFDRYVFAEVEAPVDLVKRGSPIDVARSLAELPAVRGAWGMERRGVLVPEIVPMEGFSVGRFEVTRAQWHAFHAETPVAAGQENLPMAGVSSKEAQAYVAWLKRRTGQPFRLLSQVEWKKIAKARGKRENTLDAWAGYAPRPREALQLRRELERLGWSRVLTPVGSRPPGTVTAGGKRQLLFDVGGNVAEWVLDAQGRPRAMGGCAVLASDHARPRPPELLPWTGLRVALGAGDAAGGGG